MNALLQLMALPAACMVFAWARHGSAMALARALYRAVAMIAACHVAQASPPACLAVKAAPKAGRPLRGWAIVAPLRPFMTRGGRLPRNLVSVRATSAGGRFQRARPRWAMGTTTP